MTTASQRLRATISLVRGGLTARIRQVWTHPRFAELYPEFLFCAYGVTSTSPALMRTAADRCAAAGPDELLAGWLRDYYLEHAEEETGHDEWILNDLASLGIARERVTSRLPYPDVIALVGAQYYWMTHVDPVAFLGYLAVLEQPTDLGFLHEVSARTGIPLESMSAHVLHATLDPAHVAEFDETLDRLPLTARQSEIITISAVTTVAHLERVFTDLVDHFARIDRLFAHSTVFVAAPGSFSAAPVSPEAGTAQPSPVQG